jgi:hypothetical protein
MQRLLIVPFILFTASASAEEEQQNPYLWKPQTKSVAVFKNGLAFYIREAETELRDGWCVAEQIPPASFGTLAVFANDENKIVDIVGAGPGEIFEFDDRDLPKTIEAKRKSLELSLHLKVELRYLAKGEIKIAAGEIVQVGEEFVILDNGTNNFAVPIKEITRMQALGLPLRLHVADKAGEGTEKPAVKETASGKMSLGMAYLSKGGITWVPEYTLRLIDEENAELVLRGTIINEAEDLVHADIHLVVGVPHFAHSDQLAPIAVGQVIRTIGTALSRQIPSQVMSQMSNSATFSNTLGNDARGFVTDMEVPDQRSGNLAQITGNLPQLETLAGTDFTVYTKSDMTLRRGEKAIVTLFTKKVTFSHLYRWTIPGNVQHRLILPNQTATPWTTGPCLVLSPERQPLSEDILYYTAKGARCELPITAAVNMVTAKNEKETARKTKAYSPNNNDEYYDVVTLDGKLELQSFEKNTVEVIVEATVPGTPTELSEGGSSSMNPDKLRLLEKEANVRWKFEMKSGEKKTIPYVYERYVPSK